jgi:hypothetical protein
MKKIIFILIASIFLFGCPSDSDFYTRYYSIENNSNHSLSIRFYINNVLIEHLSTTFSNNGERYTGQSSYGDIGIDVFSFPSSAYDSSDSIVIDFDNLKRQIYTIDFINQTFSEPIERNIFRHENYEEIGNDRFLFKITEDDYNNADDI